MMRIVAGAAALALALAGCSKPAEKAVPPVATVRTAAVATRMLDETVTAFGLLADVSTGYPVLLTEMTLLTALRTAATSPGRKTQPQPCRPAGRNGHHNPKSCLHIGQGRCRQTRARPFGQP